MHSSPFRVSDAGASRLCKAGFFARFKKLAGQFRRTDLMQYDTYHSAKDAATDYQLAKRLFTEHMHEAVYGKWQQKPTAVDSFVR